MPARGEPAPGTLQVRARDADHLNQFRARWCPELGPTVKTPTFDYETRAYIAAPDLAAAVARMVTAIDADKFKPLTHGPEGLKAKAKRDRLHDAYLAMWNAGLRIRPAAAWSSSAVTKPDPDAPAGSRCVMDGHFFPHGRRVKKCPDCGTTRNRAGVLTYPPGPGGSS